MIEHAQQATFCRQNWVQDDEKAYVVDVMNGGNGKPDCGGVREKAGVIEFEREIYQGI